MTNKELHIILYNKMIDLVKENRYCYDCIDDIKDEVIKIMKKEKFIFCEPPFDCFACKECDIDCDKCPIEWKDKSKKIKSINENYEINGSYYCTKSYYGIIDAGMPGGVLYLITKRSIIYYLKKIRDLWK